MSDENLSEKLIESLTNIMKKTVIFEKKERIQRFFIVFTICSSIFGLFTIYNTYTCVKIENKSNDIENKINNIENILRDNTNIPNLYYKILLDCQNNVYKVNQLQNNINDKVENINKNVISLIKDKVENINDKVE